ncbi:YhjD/YihY/BrkB family envelope integrity protein [Agromyces sp. Leaf222]|uniref:YhjD/YihY/BrkB family envelope integrity protein n=1 Tax=Agromyces sp. Leaf222 TaxID=1735688 RepID=UPI001F36C85E|nr:YhjD/YihY/BrkB family envelope integrity protein [Agromyces sp. Leaf222]
MGGEIKEPERLPEQTGFMARMNALIAWAMARKPVRAYLRYMKVHGPALADSVTYRTLFSVFAGVFLGFAIAGIWLAGNQQAMDALVETVEKAIPGLIGEGALIDPDDLVQPVTLSIAGAIALIGLVTAMIGAIGSLRVAIRRIGGQPDPQTFFLWTMLRDLLLAIGFGALLVGAAAITFFSTAALDMLFGWLGLSRSAEGYTFLTGAVAVLVIFAIDTVVVAGMFLVLSGVRPNAGTLWVGALIGGAGLTVLQELSGLFVGGATSNPLLASFGSLIALLLWLNLSSQVILIAAAYIITGVEDRRDREWGRERDRVLERVRADEQRSSGGRATRRRARGDGFADGLPDGRPRSSIVLRVVRGLVAPLTRTRVFRAIAPVLLPPIEAVIGWTTGGRVQLSALLVPSLVLHTVGAKTGEPRDTPLMYTPDGHGRAIVAGTTFAMARHPGWTYNLLRRPDAAITVRGRELAVRASLIDADAEREAAWALIEAQWPGYRAYERDSGRVVRLFRLQPVPNEVAPGA